MPQPITQDRISKLEVFGLDEILDMVREGAFLSEIAERLSATIGDDIRKSLLSRWLTGNLKRNISLGASPRETREDAAKRGLEYAKARKDWADAYVETEARKLSEETSDKHANLRKAQAEFAMRLAAVFDKKYQTVAAANVQVNVGVGDAHLAALMRRQVEPLPRLVQEQDEIEDAEVLAIEPATSAKLDDLVRRKFEVEP